MTNGQRRDMRGALLSASESLECMAVTMRGATAGAVPLRNVAAMRQETVARLANAGLTIVTLGEDPMAMLDGVPRLIEKMQVGIATPRDCEGAAAQLRVWAATITDSIWREEDAA
jgi:hypothetical protein